MVRFYFLIWPIRRIALRFRLCVLSLQLGRGFRLSLKEFVCGL